MSELDELAERLDELEPLIRTVAYAAAQKEEATVELLAQMTIRLDAVEAQLARSDPGPSGDVPEHSARAWHVRATERDWVELIDWVDWMQTVYAPKSSWWLPPCWPRHPGVVEELAAVHTAWIHAARTDEQQRESDEHSDELTRWHEHWLWPALSRAKSYTSLDSCSSDKGHNPGRTPTLTDRESLPFAAQTSRGAADGT